MAKNKYHIKGMYSNNLKLYRERSGLSQERLAKESGVSRTYISSVEQGTSRLTLKMAQKFSEILHVDPYELLGRDAIKYTGGFLQSLNSLVLANFDNQVKNCGPDGPNDPSEYFTYMICFTITSKKVSPELMKAIFTTVDSMTSHLETKDTMPDD